MISRLSVPAIHRVTLVTDTPSTLASTVSAGSQGWAQAIVDTHGMFNSTISAFNITCQQSGIIIFSYHLGFNAISLTSVGYVQLGIVKNPATTNKILAKQTFYWGTANGASVGITLNAVDLASKGNVYQFTISTLASAGFTIASSSLTTTVSNWHRRRVSAIVLPNLE